MVTLFIFMSIALGFMGAAALMAARRAADTAPDEPMALPARLGWHVAWLAAWGASLYLLADATGWLKAVFIWLAIISLAGGGAVFLSGWRVRR